MKEIIERSQMGFVGHEVEARTPLKQTVSCHFRESYEKNPNAWKCVFKCVG